VLLSPSIPRALAVLALAALLLAVSAQRAGADANGDAIAAVNSFNPDNELSYPPLESVIEDGRAQLVALRSQLGASQLPRRWAAMYVGHNLARREADYRRLRPRLKDRDPSIRAMAAFALIGAGKKEAIPVLIRLLSSRQFLLYGEPLEPIATLANERLVRRTRADFRFNHYGSASARRKAIKKWNRWWDEVKGNIRWDRGGQRFRWRRERNDRTVPNGAPAPGVDGGGSPALPPPPQPAPRTTGSSVNENLEVTVNIQLSPAAGRDAGSVSKVMALKQAAENFLNGSGRTGGCVNVTFKLNMQQGSGTPNFHQIKVLNGKSDRYRGARIDDIPDNPGESTTGRLLDGDDAKTLAHEALHLMGLYDEYTRKSNGYSVPNDPDSVLGDDDSPTSQVLQRTLDALAGRFDQQDQRNCQKFSLKFADWRTQGLPRTFGSGNSRRHIIGLRASAALAPDFWFNPRTGVITPAGDAPCGTLNLRTPCPRNVDPRTGGGNSTSGVAEANKGAAPCSRVTFMHLEKFFNTRVTGAKQGDQFALNLQVGDGQQASYTCNPPARPPTERKNLIRQGMGAAKNGAGETALSFKTAIPPMGGSVGPIGFDYSADLDSANGEAVVSRIR
jgi:hypothetical protein